MNDHRDATRMQINMLSQFAIDTQVPIIINVQVAKNRTQDRGSVNAEDIRRNKSKQYFDQLLKDLLG